MGRMRVELVGPRAVGKSSVADAVADHLGLRTVSGQGFHDADGRELTAQEIRRDRLISVVQNPRLFATTLVTYRGRRGTRVRFALNTCRRNRFAARTDDAVFESGPMHGLVQGAAN